MPLIVLLRTQFFREVLHNALIQVRQELLLSWSWTWRQHGLHCLHAALIGQRDEHAAHDHHCAQCLVVQQQFFATCAGDGRRRWRGRHVASASLRSRISSIVAGALKLFEDHVVHTAAGIDQAGGDDRQAATLFDIARRAKEALGRIKRAGIDAAGERASALRDDRQVIGARSGG